MTIRHYTVKRRVNAELVPFAELQTDPATLRKVIKAIPRRKPTEEQIATTTMWLPTRWRNNDKGFPYLAGNHNAIEIRGTTVVCMPLDGTHEFVIDKTFDSLADAKECAETIMLALLTTVSEDVRS
jgi:hypothetical protein